MELLIYLIPFVTSILLCVFFRKYIVWWEYIVLIIPSLVLICLMKNAIVYYNSIDTQYLGTYVTKIIYYEPWNELVQVRHTDTYPCGTNSNGTTKFCTRVWYTTEVRNHKEKFTYFVKNDNIERSISKEVFNKIKNRLNSKPYFKELNRNYHTKDGDAYVTVYDGNMEHLYDVAIKDIYQNKIKATHSNTIFKFQSVDNQTKDLYDYPDIINETQTPIIGKKLPFKDEKIIRYINAVKGKEKEFRTYILFFKHDEFDKSERQKMYWQNGNKNEFVLCIGVKNDSVVWTNPFSWADKPILESKVKKYFIENPKLDIYQYGLWLNKHVDTDWERKEFGDFDYINIELNFYQYLLILIVTISCNIVLSIFLIKNNYKN